MLKPTTAIAAFVRTTVMFTSPSSLRSPQRLYVFAVLDRHQLAALPSPPMPLQVLQRPHWHGTPIELGDLFRLHKNRREARAALFTDQRGWEVQLPIGSQLEVVQTQVCRDQQEVLPTWEQRKTAMDRMGGRGDELRKGSGVC